jgi:hypothetical protein
VATPSATTPSTAPSAGVTPAPSAAPPSPSPVVPLEFTAAEARLRDQLRVDAQVACEPRRSNLPTGATAGIECRPGAAHIDRVGAFQFPDPAAALAAYVARLEAYGVELRSGECGAGIPGDGAWTPGDEPGSPLIEGRVGCFHDEFGTANFRLTCGDGRYIGVLGTDEAIAPLHEWAWTFDANYHGDVPSPPGICYGPGPG